MTQTITIPTGKNIGRTIIGTLEASNLYDKVTIINFNIIRKPKTREITALIKYKFKIKKK